MEYYEIIGDHAFTEDKILVQKLLVTNLPVEATPLKVAEYFKKFGNVCNVQMLRDGADRRCVIHFDDPKEAAMVLKKESYLFMNSLIHVAAYDSSFQPEGQELMALLHRTKNKFTCNRANTTDQKALILTLNDDCLEHICKNLPTEDQINFALTCQRFYDILVMLSKVQYSTFDTSDIFNVTLFKNKIFLQIVGSQIKTLTIGPCIDSELNLNGLFCTNVEKLKVRTQPNINFRKLIAKMRLLQDLELSYNNLNADFIRYLAEFKHLKSLNVKSCFGVSGKNIHLLCGLEKLSLPGCDLASSHFRDICKNLKKLHYLEIASESPFLKTEDYEYVSTHLLQLQTLKLCFNGEKVNYNCIANLPKLKNLEINGNVSEEFLKSFNADQLEELRINSSDMCFEKALLVATFKNLKVLHFEDMIITNETLLVLSQLTELKEISLEKCFEVTDNAFLKLLENCLKLEHLYMKLNDKGLTQALLPTALKLVQEQRALCRRTNTVEVTFVFLDRKGYFIDSASNHIMEEYKHLIKINVLKHFYDDYDGYDETSYLYDDYYYDNVSYSSNGPLSW